MNVNSQLAVLLNLAQFQIALQAIMLSVLIIIAAGATLIIFTKTSFLFVKILEV
jgi:hypothetical protein